MFDALSNRLQDVFQSLKGETRLTESTVERVLSEIRLALLEADVNFKVVKAFVDRVRDRAMEADVLGSLSASQQVLFGVAAMAIVAAGGAVTWMGSGTDWRLLYGRLDEAEVGRIVSVLEGQKVAHRIVSGGTGVQVPASQVHALRAQLAAKGMPKADGTGFEIFDKQKLGATDFQQKVDYQRALEGEIARQIESGKLKPSPDNMALALAK
mgnify:CR=1 FL=1